LRQAAAQGAEIDAVQVLGLVDQGLLRTDAGGGRSTSYTLTDA
jgi:hypothetical protein